ncbi:hypothetical protein BH23ACT5_BH23ACT5_03490 [soil metagenome]
MHSDLLAALDAFDRAVAAADGLVTPEVLDPVAATVRSVRNRAGYLGETVVAAVAGGTGSGKSSLINAMAGEVVTESGGMRPTTDTPVAWIPANPEPGLTRLLDDLGVEERVGQELHPWLALIDLPDTDSVVVDNRHTVAALLPRVDLVLWVIDPEKYQDRILHEDYLQRLSAYQRQFVFVVNQIDRLDSVDVDAVVDDLRSTLSRDGIADPRVVAVAADPQAGPPIGVEELVAELERSTDVKAVVYAKLSTDLATAAEALAGSPDLSGGVGFEERWASVRGDGADAVAGGDVRRADGLLAGFVADLAAEVGGGAGDSLRSEVAPLVPSAIEVAYESSGAFRRPPAAGAPPWLNPTRVAALGAAALSAVWGFDQLRVGGVVLWPFVVVVAALGLWFALGVWSSASRTRESRRLAEEHRDSLTEPITRHLEAQLGRPLRQVLRRRAGATAAATELNLALAELERRLGD